MIVKKMEKDKFYNPGGKNKIHLFQWVDFVSKMKHIYIFSLFVGE